MFLLIGLGPSKSENLKFKYQKSQLDNYLSSWLMHVKRLHYYDLVKNEEIGGKKWPCNCRLHSNQPRQPPVE